MLKIEERNAKKRGEIRYREEVENWGEERDEERNNPLENRLFEIYARGQKEEWDEERRGRQMGNDA